MKRFPLTEEQKQGFAVFDSFLNDPESLLFLFNGAAGTGKTYLVSTLIDYLINFSNNKVAVTATTHKALRVLKRDIALVDAKIKYATAHSILGLRENIDAYGKQTFLPDPKVPASITKFNIVFVDEISQLNDDLFYQFYNHSNKRNIKIVFIGDSAQIPPINKLDSIPLLPNKQKEFNIDVFTLNTIIRQKAGNDIISLAFDIRSDLTQKNIFPSILKYSNSKNLKYLNVKDPEQFDTYLLLLVDYFKNEQFAKDPDFAKLIAWRNEVVGDYNDIIRSIMYDNSNSKLVKGEKLIMDAPYIKDDEIMLNNNDEIEVMGFDIATTNLKYSNVDKLKLKFYRTGINRKTIENTDEHFTINIVHEDSEKEFQNAINTLKNLAKKEVQGSYQAKNAWVKYFKFQEHFAKIAYNYAITAHKSQGSTYTNAICVYNDVMNNYNVVERNRILYTGFTRPKENLIII